MKNRNHFDVLLLVARPAAGKSEIINHLKHTAIPKRLERFHIGDFEEIDDFPMLWTWFEEDYILEKLGHPRLHSDENQNFREKYLWDVLIERICLEYDKKLRDHPEFHNTKTAIIEFARGREHGGFARAFQHLSTHIIHKMAILYINVSWEESIRKNRARYNPSRPDSILEHGLPDEKMERIYRFVDWEEICSVDPEFLEIQGIKVPYAVLENEDDVTTQGGEKLALRLEETLGRLWKLYQKPN